MKETERAFRPMVGDQDRRTEDTVVMWVEGADVRPGKFFRGTIRGTFHAIYSFYINRLLRI